MKDEIIVAITIIILAIIIMASNDNSNDKKCFEKTQNLGCLK